MRLEEGARCSSLGQEKGKMGKRGAEWDLTEVIELGALKEKGGRGLGVRTHDMDLVLNAFVAEHAVGGGKKGQRNRRTPR